jgi:hypothetical protein
MISGTVMRRQTVGSNYVMADATHYSCSGYVNGRICTNGQRVRRDVLEKNLLAGIKSTLLSDQGVEDVRGMIIRALQKPGTDANRIPKLEQEVANHADVIGQGIRSNALLEHLRTAETELARLRNQSKVVDVSAIMKLLPATIRRYWAIAGDLGNPGGHLKIPHPWPGQNPPPGGGGTIDDYAV